MKISSRRLLIIPKIIFFVLCCPLFFNLLVQAEVEVEDDAVIEKIELSDLEAEDDLEELKSDLGIDLEFLDDELSEEERRKKEAPAPFPKVEDEKMSESANEETPKESGESKEIFESDQVTNNPRIFKTNETDLTEIDTGKEEKGLLEIARFIENKIPDKEWDEIAAATKTDKYVIEEGDWLWKISQRLFGSGFYYSKIWSLNPYITNPHEITPGMVLVFDTGDSLNPPTVKMGSFAKQDKSIETVDLSTYEDLTEPAWLKERQRLINEGFFIQYSTNNTYEDLEDASALTKKTEYQRYWPPKYEFEIEQSDNYDESGFDKNSKIQFNYQEGFHLTTFVTTNLVQDLGEIDSARNASLFLKKYDMVYVHFDPAVRVAPGDLYSLYTADGKVEHELSDRKGNKYTIVGEIKVIKKISHLWECEITYSNGVAQRGDRVTVHTPTIERILQTFNARIIEAAVLSGYEHGKNQFGFGDVLYLDRGRADGVELGNVFEVFSFMDRATERKITPDPTYKIGEITVITLTDNFATGLVTSSKRPIELGHISITKTMEALAMAVRIKNRKGLEGVESLEHEALSKLDVELNLDSINNDLLKKADQIELTEDELDELERQEMEKSIIKKGEKDLRELERLEKDIGQAEAQLRSAKLDEDQYLEDQDLDDIERKVVGKVEDTFDAINEIEHEEGRKYLDEDLNSRDNPFGLTEYDLEEVDELMDAYEQKNSN